MFYKKACGTHSLKSPGAQVQRSADIALLCRLKLIVGEAVTEFSSLIVMEMIAFFCPTNGLQP